MRHTKQKIIDIVKDLIFLVVGVGSSYLSILYSIRLFIYNGISVFNSTVFSVVYILFITVIFTQGIKYFIDWKRIEEKLQLYKEKTINYKILKNRSLKNLFKGIILILVWFFLVIYSVAATIGGQYDQLSKLEISRRDRSESHDEIPLIEKKISLLKNQKSLYQKEVKIIETRLNSIKDVEKSFTYKNTSARNEKRLDLLRKKIIEVDQKIMDLHEEVIKIQIQKNEIKGSIYQYFERIFNLPSFIIQFIMSFFPSVVIDLFAPVSFSMFLYRKNS